VETIARKAAQRSREDFLATAFFMSLSESCHDLCWLTRQPSING
jgi:hypothetical protein